MLSGAWLGLCDPDDRVLGLVHRFSSTSPHIHNLLVPRESVFLCQIELPENETSSFTGPCVGRVVEKDRAACCMKVTLQAVLDERQGMVVMVKSQAAEVCDGTVENGTA
ncbi:hypothetical protein BaRGS_00006384 [Batillaria attramentaria]|uniref:Uncharacterized protein n=1 Tax=Batillaria attramentaria TaxID=370345 RepID=A0ABD0LT81_9CAEN